MCTVCETIKSLDSYSVEYLGWITAIVGGIIALTTIIFTHYNERSIEKSNDIVEEIKAILLTNKENKANIPYNELSMKFNKIVQALSNNYVYKITLLFFEIILYVLVVLWSFGSLGYALNAKTWPEKVLIMMASFILIAVFFFIPEIVKMFNKNKALMVTNKNNCSFNEALNFFQYNNILTKKEIIPYVITPTLKISINNEDHIILEYNQGLVITEYAIIFKLVKSNTVIYICLNIDSEHQTFKFTTDTNTGITFKGLYDLIKTASKTNGNIFIFDKVNLDKKVFKLGNILTEDGEIILSTNNSQTVTNRVVDEIFEKKTCLIKVINGSPNDEKEYLINKIN